MAEQTMRGRVIRALAPLNGIAVENPALPGTPDVNYIEGWIELKWFCSWPVRPDTAVQFETFTPQQRVWHIRRRRAGGKSWMLVQCGKEWMLFDGATAALNFNDCTYSELKALCSEYSDKGLDAEELVRWISQDQKPFIFDGDVREQLSKLLRKGTELPPTDI